MLDEQSIPLRCSGHPTSLYFEKKFPHKIGPWKFRASGHFGPNGALLGPPGAQERPDTRSKCVVTMCPTQAGQSGAVGTKSGPPGPSEDLRGPQKGHFGPKRSLLGPLGPQKGPDTRSKCVVSMSLTQTGQSGLLEPNLVPRGCPRTSGAPQPACFARRLENHKKIYYQNHKKTKYHQNHRQTCLMNYLSHSKHFPCDDICSAVARGPG